MSNSEASGRVWDLVEKFKTCMFATSTGEMIHARPMAPVARRNENAIYFLTDVRGRKDDEIEARSPVCLTFADHGANTFICISGEALVRDDRPLIRDLWSMAAQAWWENADDPNIRVVEVIPRHAEYWDGPNSLVSSVVLATAAMTGGEPDLGEHRKVDLQ
ncbi:MAG: pyridoxamine 5'-phosphate oxidase family protein [Hyphomonadaceae bacterium]